MNVSDYWNLELSVKWVRKNTKCYGPVPDPPEVPAYIMEHLTNRLYKKMSYPKLIEEKSPVEKYSTYISPEDSPYWYWDLELDAKWLKKDVESTEKVPTPRPVPPRFMESLDEELDGMMECYLWPEPELPFVYVALVWATIVISCLIIG